MDSLKVMILGARSYNFEDKNTGRAVKGTTVHYIPLQESAENDKLGYFPTKATLQPEFFEYLQGVEFPCVADATITLDMTNNRNPIKVTNFKVLQSVKTGK